MKKQTANFCKFIEGSAQEQFNEAMEMPFAIKGALMPDAHTGYSLPIGAVVATDNVIVPSWVGYDIGCGMCAVKTTFAKAMVFAMAEEIFQRIYEIIPTGVGKYNDKDGIFPALKCLPTTPVFNDIFQKRNGLKQLGSLGSGNHFIEIGYDENDAVWVIIHSGSRGIGHGIAEHYMRQACVEAGLSPLTKSLEGNFGFDLMSQNGQDYMNDMNMCLAFALESRRQMINNVCAILFVYCEEGGVDFRSFINRNHNHAEPDKYGSRTIIHRKGATHAELGMMGVIPGNWEDGSFIVRGKGNTESLCSSSHGAGRLMSRAAARRMGNVETEREHMLAKGIVAKVEESTIDEAKGAYKDIFEVMELQRDLVEIIHHVKPMINVKG